MIHSAYPVPAIRYDHGTPDVIPVYYYEELPSTNLTAKEILTANSHHGVVLADRQTAGRGRLGRSFFSEGGIYLSCMIPQRSLPIPSMLLTTAAAAAVCRAIKAEGFDAKIKWVNDILLDGKKICGILAETVSEGDAILGYVVGIGINIGMADFPDEIAETAGSLPGDAEIKEELIESVIRNFYTAISEKPEAIVSYCTENSGVIGSRIRYFGAKEGTGTAVGLAENGGLIVKRDDGTETVLTGGEISVRTE